jgi:hypothetical protein
VRRISLRSLRSRASGFPWFDDNTSTQSPLETDMRTRPSRAALALMIASALAGAGVTDAALAADAPAPAASQPANAVRPEFAVPFNAAQDLMKAGKGPEALAKLKELSALPNPTPYEQYLIVRVRAPAEYASGDLGTASADFETVLASDQLPAADRLPIMKALAEILYSSQQYPKAVVWMQRYFEAGGEDAQLRELLPQTMYASKDYAGAAKAFQAQVDAQLAAGTKPTEKTYRLLASSQSQAGDDAAYAKTLERVAVAYPKPDYWKEVIARATQSEKLADRLYPDLYRLKAAAFGQTSDSERLSYASVSMRAGFPAETRRILDEGLAKKSFTGADLAEATKLRDSAAKAAAQDKAQATANEAAAKAAKDGNALVSLGLLDTLDGDPAQGVALLNEGIARGGVKAPDDARLHLGYAQYRAGRYADAAKTFQAVNGPGGLGALAHAWTLLAQSQAQAQSQTQVAPAAATTATVTR